MTRRLTGKWKTAIHEAGHAVVARELGIPFEEVTIIPRTTPTGIIIGATRQLGGECNHLDDWEYWFGLATVNYAGWVAIGRARGCHYNFSDLGIGNDDGDIAHAIWCAREFLKCLGIDSSKVIGGGWNTAFHKDAERAAKAIIKERWDDVLAIAEALYEKKTLTDAEISEIIGFELPCKGYGIKKEKPHWGPDPGGPDDDGYFRGHG